MNNSTGSHASSPSPQPQEIERRARSIWEEEGRPEGRAFEHWLAAERELRANHSNGTTSSKNGYKEKAHKPAEAGNPACPPLEERAAIVAGRNGSPEHVEKLPASKLAGAGKAGSTPKPDASATLVASKRGKRAATTARA